MKTKGARNQFIFAQISFKGQKRGEMVKKYSYVTCMFNLKFISNRCLEVRKSAKKLVAKTVFKLYKQQYQPSLTATNVSNH